MLPAFADCLILTGPTASGKSAVALEFAERANAEIVAMDSMTLYRGMDIGTAKPTASDRQRVPHHLIDVLDPTESASVAWWLREAETAVRAIRDRGRVPLFVGGTPFYLRAMVYGLFKGPPIDPAIRQELERQLAERGSAFLHGELASVDAVAAGRLHPNDGQRIVRALEVHRQTGQPLSSLQQQDWFARPTASTATVRGCPQILILDPPRGELYARIEGRVEGMIRQGWIDEVRQLARQYPAFSREASQAVGYRILKEHLEGALDLQTAIGTIQMKTRQFAKHQYTWFRNSPYGTRCGIREVLLNWSAFLM